MTDRRLIAADRRRNQPDLEFSTAKFVEGRATAVEKAAAAQHYRARCDAAVGLYGLAAPTIAAGESLIAYRRRLAQTAAAYCERLSGVNFSKIPTEALPPLEKMAYEGAVALFEKPEGPERSCVRRDHTGREVTHFFGDAEAVWLPFTSAVALNGVPVGFKVGRINTSLFTGKNGFEARAQAARAQERVEAGLAALAREEARTAAAG